ncbi:Fur family transcriptional regulator [Roseivirga pacifica]|uniref:Fur family transcriptional regulator n=1 Tax=Roseivirga pacifica TaxID=1267423 RepID=UPI003BAF1999
MRKVNETKSLLTILDKFDQSEEALSVIGLIEELSEMMNRTTVYRILARLEDKGTLHSFIGNDGIRWYAKNTDCQTELNETHPHFQCEACGKTTCLPVNVPVPKLPHHKISAVSFIIVGNCGNCQPE